MPKPTTGLPQWDSFELNTTEPDTQRKEQGWLAPGGVPEKPSFLFFNYWMNDVYKWVKAINDLGILNYDAATDYVVGAIAQGSDGKVYQALVDNGPGSAIVNPVGDTTGVWGFLVPASLNRNILVNGDFNIWQRETLFVAASGDVADTWLLVKAGGMALTVTRDSDTPTESESGHGSSFSLKVDVTTGLPGGIPDGNFTFLETRVEGYDFQKMIGNTCVLSFWVKSALTGTYCVSLQNENRSDYFLLEYDINSANTWERKTLVVPDFPTSVFWNRTNGTGLRVLFALAVGVNSHGTLGGWNSGFNIRSTSNQVDFTQSGANNFWISQVQLELGETPTKFETKRIDDELSACQRYFQKSYVQGQYAGEATSNGMVSTSMSDVANSTYSIKRSVELPVGMRSLPSVTTYSTSGSGSRVDVVSGAVSPSITNISENSFVVSASDTTPTTTRLLEFQYVADATLP
jgi:hypothetical protein